MNLEQVKACRDREIAKAITQKEKDIIEAKYKYMTETANGKPE